MQSSGVLTRSACRIHLDQPVGGRRDPLDPRLSRAGLDQVHRRMEDGVPVVGEERGAPVEAVVEERLVDLEHRRVLLPLDVVHRVPQDAVDQLPVRVAIRHQFRSRQGAACRNPLVDARQPANLRETAVGGVQLRWLIAIAEREHDRSPVAREPETAEQPRVLHQRCHLAVRHVDPHEPALPRVPRRPGGKEAFAVGTPPDGIDLRRGLFLVRIQRHQRPP